VIAFVVGNFQNILTLLAQHIGISLGALVVATLIALPLGWLLHYQRWLATPVLGLLGVIYTIPSIALIIFLIPIFGLNAESVIVALVLYAQIIMVRNVLAGLDGIDPAVIESAHGMGMNFWQLAWRVQLPLALPVILAGLRIAGIVCVAIATIGAKFGSGGLGVLLFNGIALGGRMDMIWTGAILVGLLAFAINQALKSLEKRFTLYLQV
jgi:osmoprotectant transport system permease protein